MDIVTWYSLLPLQNLIIMKNALVNLNTEFNYLPAAIFFAKPYFTHVPKWELPPDHG